MNDIKDINTVQFRKKDLQGKKFKICRFILFFHPYGVNFFRKFIYAIQFFILVPVAFIIDLIFLVLGFILKFLFNEIKNLWSGAKQLTSKLLYELLKALIKPFLMLTSVFVFAIIMYSLFKDISIIQGFEIVYQKLF